MCHVSPGIVLGNGRKLGYGRFGGIAVGRFKCGKMDDHQNKKFFMNNLMRGIRMC